MSIEDTDTTVIFYLPSGGVFVCPALFLQRTIPRQLLSSKQRVVWNLIDSPITHLGYRVAEYRSEKATEPRVRFSEFYRCATVDPKGLVAARRPGQALFTGGSIGLLMGVGSAGSMSLNVEAPHELLFPLAFVRAAWAFSLGVSACFPQRCEMSK